MVAQVPALFELLSGTRIGDLMSRVPALSNQEEQSSAMNNTSPNGTGATVDTPASES
jgi:flotillin